MDHVQDSRIDVSSDFLPSKQVLDWLENQGEVFLTKNCGVGRNLSKAIALQRCHENFERVALVSLIVHLYSTVVNCKGISFFEFCLRPCWKVENVREEI